MNNVEYFVLQEEEAPTTGTHHWQGFCILKKKEKINWMQRRFPHGTHFEVARGTNQEASEYCKKDETHVPDGLRVEIGQLPVNNLRKGETLSQAAMEVLEATKEGGFKRPHDVPSDVLMRPGFLTAFKTLTTDCLGPYRPDLKIITMVGPPGSGKSFALYKHFPDAGRCLMGNSGIWFQNATSEAMAFEEFCGQIQLQRMLTLLDKFPLALEVKGDTRPAMYKWVIITSNTRPDGWYKGDEAGQPGKRTDALLALWDRIGFSNGGFVPTRTTGYYLEPPMGANIQEMRDYFDKEVEHIINQS